MRAYGTVLMSVQDIVASYQTAQPGGIPYYLQADQTIQPASRPTGQIPPWLLYGALALGGVLLFSKLRK